MTEQSPILQVKNLEKVFGGLFALRDVSFEVPSGLIYSIIGPNGAGKTTLLNCISGVLKPSRGEIFFNNTRIDNLKAHQIAKLGISRTFQHVALFKNMTVIENVAVGRHLKSKAGFLECALRLPSMSKEEKDIFEKAKEYLSFVGLSDDANKKAGSLPLGQQKLLEIARALATEPKLLLLDEPAAGLNTSETEQLGEMIKKIRDSGITVILIEHDMNLVMEISDTILVLHFGRVLTKGTPLEVKNDSRVIEVYLGKME